MPTDRPDAVELLEAVREFLMEHIAPTLEGQPAFHMRVATNALAIVQRTLTEGDAMDTAELYRLKELLGREGSLLELNHILAEKIRTGEMDHQRSEVLEHLRQTALAKVRLVNPRHLISRD